MKAARFTSKGSKLEVVELPIPTPGPYQVRLKILACGICRGDDICKYAAFPQVVYPRIPGHEIVGTVDELGEGVTAYSKGETVGVGWNGGSCGKCESCNLGDRPGCKQGKATGSYIDGGYAEYGVFQADSLVRVPSNIPPEEVTPLMCAGVTTYSALLEAKLTPGSVVVIQGIGGLGHLAIQYANKMGMEVIALSTSKSKEQLARDLGAHHFFTTEESSKYVEEIKKLGGANLILATAPNHKLIPQMMPALAKGGRLIFVAGIHDPVELNPLPMMINSLSFSGWVGGNKKNLDSTVRFSVLTKTKSMVEKFPLEKAQEAYECMESNKANFRAVLVMNRK